jgi:hypothetical protein
VSKKTIFFQEISKMLSGTKKNKGTFQAKTTKPCRGHIPELIFL